MADGSGAEPQRSLCPICRKYTTMDFRPFCSKRCADVDLGRWLGEGYRIPTFEEPSEEESANLPREDDQTG